MTLVTVRAAAAVADTFQGPRGLEKLGAGRKWFSVEPVFYGTFADLATLAAAAASPVAGDFGVLANGKRGFYDGTTWREDVFDVSNPELATALGRAIELDVAKYTSFTVSSAALQTGFVTLTDTELPFVVPGTSCRSIISVNPNGSLETGYAEVLTVNSNSTIIHTVLSQGNVVSVTITGQRIAIVPNGETVDFRLRALDATGEWAWNNRAHTPGYTVRVLQELLS